MATPVLHQNWSTGRKEMIVAHAVSSNGRELVGGGVGDQTSIDGAPKSGQFSRYLYSHFTCAIDSENIRRVFAACKDIVQHWYLQQTMLT